MRKLLSTFLVLVICFSISTQSFAAESTMDCDMMISTSDADSISILAARHLEDMKASFPNAKIVADKYHVVRQVTWAFENVRKRIQSDFVKEHRIYMKGSRRLLLKRQNSLSSDEMLEVAKLLRYSKELGASYYLKERFYELMESTNIYEAEERLNKWIMHAKIAGIPEFNAVLTTISNWREEIINAFRYNITNGYTEGCNNLIKVIKRTGYGLRNFDRFRNRILHIASS